MCFERQNRRSPAVRSRRAKGRRMPKQGRNVPFMPCPAALRVPVPVRSRLTNDTTPVSGRTMILSAERERSGPLRQTIPKKASACRRKPSSTPSRCLPSSQCVHLRPDHRKQGSNPSFPAANATGRERAANAIRHSPADRTVPNGACELRHANGSSQRTYTRHASPFSPIFRAGNSVPRERRKRALSSAE